MLGINIPEDEKGNWKVEIDNGECSLVKLSLGYSIMKDSEYEYDAHQWLWDNATGDIFIGGLGIGFLNKELIDNHNFNSVTIIENSQDVIDLVWPYCARDSRFTLIQADIETWNIPAGSHWDVGWFDTYLGDNPLSINGYFSAIKTKYGSFCDKMGTRLINDDLHNFVV
mgnify:FL=1